MSAVSVAAGPGAVGAVGSASGVGPAERATDGPTPATERTGHVPPRGQWPRRWAAVARRHWLITAFLTVGAALRLLTMYAYRPAFEFSGDSYAYLTLSRLHQPDPMRPAGYPVLLKILGHTHRIAVVPAVQHLAGLAIGLALYALLLRRQTGRVAAALAAAPVLLDAYQLDIEHFVMAETLFLALLVGALVALLWSPTPSVAASGLAGGLLAASGLVRTLGAVLGVLALGYLVIRRLGWLRAAVFAVVFAAPLAGYAAWYHSYHGTYALSGGDNAWLYGRVAPIADCSRLRLSPEQLPLCSPHPPADRPGPNYYVWSDTSPRYQLKGTAEHRNEVLGGFAHQVIRRQPLDYARMVAADVGHYFAPGRQTGYRDWPDESWRFPDAATPRYVHTSEPLLDFDERHPPRVVHEWAAGLLRGYQSWAYTPGPLLAVLVAVALVATGLGLPRPRLPARGPLPAWGRLPAWGGRGTDGGPAGPGGTAGSPGDASAAPGSIAASPGSSAASPGGASADSGGVVAADPDGAVAAPRSPAGRDEAATWRRLPDRLRHRLSRGRGRTARADVDPVVGERRRIGADGALLTALGLAVLVVPSATVCFDYRYMLPVLVLFPPAAALAIRQFRLSPRR